jgi:hypothetical protein
MIRVDEARSARKAGERLQMTEEGEQHRGRALLQGQAVLGLVLIGASLVILAFWYLGYFGGGDLQIGGPPSASPRSVAPSSGSEESPFRTFTSMINEWLSIGASLVSMVVGIVNVRMSLRKARSAHRRSRRRTSWG